jgi:putative membrane protein (TIGR04086 family)
MNIDRAAVVAGATRAAIIAGLAILAAQAIRSLTDTNANLALYLVLLGGLVAGGHLAGRRQPQSPLTHGALAAVAAYAVLLAVVTGVRLALGRELADPVSFVFNGLMAASAGIFGGYLALRNPAAGA